MLNSQVLPIYFASLSAKDLQILRGHNTPDMLACYMDSSGLSYLCSANEDIDHMSTTQGEYAEEIGGTVMDQETFFREFKQSGANNEILLEIMESSDYSYML